MRRGDVYGPARGKTIDRQILKESRKRKKGGLGEIRRGDPCSARDLREQRLEKIVDPNSEIREREDVKIRKEGRNCNLLENSPTLNRRYFFLEKMNCKNHSKKCYCWGHFDCKGKLSLRHHRLSSIACPGGYQLWRED